MKQRCSLKAPAKLNLHLQVGSRRIDGFHEIKSLFVMVDFFDEVTISSLKTGNQCEIEGSFDCRPEENLVYKAWKIFNEAAETCFGIRCNVNKRIPVCSGMGGGSSDAAAVLKGMNLLFETGFTERRLRKMAEKIGSDVPFFLGGPAAIVKGRGEHLTPVKRPNVLDLIVIKPELCVSTAEAFGLIDKYRISDKFLEDDVLLDCFYSGSESLKYFTNDFYDVLKRENSLFTEIINRFYQSGAVFSNLTGSGSTVFGVYRDENDAINALKSLKNEFKFVQKIKSLDRIPYAILE